MSKGPKKKPEKASGFNWFKDSQSPELFLWAVVPKRREVLLAGNALGYKKVVRELERLKNGSHVATLNCRKPDKAPPAQWSKSPLSKLDLAPLDEIEKDFRKRVSPFDRFVWYSGLQIVVDNEGYDAGCKLINQDMKVTLPKRLIDSWIDIFTQSTFPDRGGQVIATGKDGGPNLVLAADWIGSE